MANQTGPKRSKIQREADLQTLAALYLQGYSQTAIAERLKVSQQQIGADLKKLYKTWREAALIDFNEAKQRELARIDELERSYWEAWRRSVGRVVERNKKTVTGGENAGTTDEKRIRKQAGDPRYLEGVERCIAMRVKLLGLLEPEPDGWREALLKAGHDGASIGATLAGFIATARATQGNRGALGPA